MAQSAPRNCARRGADFIHIVKSIFRQFPALAFALLAGATSTATVRAQEAPPAPPTAATAPAPDALADDVAKYGAMFKRGLFDELISNVNQKIAALPADKRDNPDPRLLYFRGLAYYGLGWFDLAKADLIVAEKAGVKEISAGRGADWILSFIEKRASLLPPKMQEIREGERVLFRMHTFGDENDAELIKAMLPEAYRINRQIFGKDVEATTVYVFDNYEQFVAYYKAFYVTSGPGTWSAASALGDSLFIVLRDDKGVLRARDDRELFKTIVFQQYNHVLFSRLVGATKQPSWFTAGLAQIASAQVDADYDARKQKSLQRLLQNNALLSLGALTNDDSFPEQIEIKLARERGDRPSEPDFYAQSYGLTKYLIDKTSMAQVQSFLLRLQKSPDFDGAFADEFGMTTEQLYANWKRDAAKQFGALAQNNDAPPIAATAPASAYSNADDTKYRQLLENAFFDELIYHVNAQIEALPAAERARPDPRLLWYRGMARYKLGRLSEAKADLTATQNDGRKTYGTTETLASIERLSALVPPKMEEIRDGERVIFRAHYYEASGATASTLALLPEAYRISRQMFGTDVSQTTVYIFDTFEQFNAYYKESTGGQKLGSWVVALTTGDVMLICLQKPNGEPVSTKDHQDFVVVHEFNHAMFNRLMGFSSQPLGFSSQPRWFVEGLAQVCETRIDTDYLARKEKYLRDLFANNTLVSLADLENDEKFDVQVEAGLALQKQGDYNSAPDPYTQGYGMAKYLLANISTPQLQSFLNRVRESKDFKASFAAEFDMTTKQFYESWKNETARQLAAR